MLKLKSLLLFVFMLVVSAVSAQMTTSAVTGNVTEGTTPIADATIILVHFLF